jgi:micrococcal nuclease
MVGINAPESRTRDLEEKKRGLAAKDFLKEILENPENDIQMQSEGKGKYGRVLGVFFWDKGKRTPVNVNQLMIKEGHAVSYFGGKRK